jgi:hypothetical protein
LFYPSANRDESVFPEPYRFDVGRKPNYPALEGNRMPRRIAAAAVAMLLGMAALPATADRLDFLVLALLKDRVDSTDEYMIFLSTGKDGATSCKFTTPSDPSGSACPVAPEGGPPGIIRTGLSFSGLTDEIGLGTGWIGR